LENVTVTTSAGKIDVDQDTGTALDVVNVKTTSTTDDVTIKGGKTVTTEGGKNVNIKGSKLENVTVTTSAGKIDVDQDTGAALDVVNVKTTGATDDVTIKGGKTVTTEGGQNVTIDGNGLAAITIKNSNGTINIGTTTASNNDLDKITIDGAAVTTVTTHTIKGEAVKELTLKGITDAFPQTFDITNSTETAITLKADDANAEVNINSVATSAIINSAGASGNSIKLNGGTGVTTLTISGTTKLTLDGSGLTGSIDGSLTTGGLHLKGFSSNVTSMKGGGGADTFEVAAGSKVTLEGGGGDDTFDVSNNTSGTGTTFTDINAVTIADFSGDTIIYGTSGSAGSVSTDFAWDTDLNTTLLSAASYNTAGEIVYFFDAPNSDTYIIINDGDTGLSADIVVKLSGMNSLTSVDYDSGKITITP